MKEMEYKVALFTSRKKDNEGLEGFKVRTRSLYTTKTAEELMDKFQEFVDRGLVGEVTRFYMSVNTRDPDKVYRDVQVDLVMGRMDLTKVEARVAALAMKPENKLSKKFLFDCDVEREVLQPALDYLDSKKVGYEVVPTMNFQALVTDGFDLREFQKLFPFAEFKRDGELYVTCAVKE